MSGANFFHLKGDDWEGVYVDGELQFEGHSVSEKLIDKLVEVGGIEYESKWLNADGYRELAIGGRFPTSLSDALEMGVEP